MPTEKFLCGISAQKLLKEVISSKLTVSAC